MSTPQELLNSFTSVSANVNASLSPTAPTPGRRDLPIHSPARTTTHHSNNGSHHINNNANSTPSTAAGVAAPTAVSTASFSTAPAPSSIPAPSSSSFAASGSSGPGVLALNLASSVRTPSFSPLSPSIAS